MTTDPYTVEQCEEDIAELRGQVDRLTEVIGNGGSIQVNVKLTATDPVNGGPETWHSLGTLANYTVNIGRYRLTPDNEVEIEVDVTAAGANAQTTTFGNTLPSAYRPQADRRLPVSSTRNVTAGDPWPRLFVQSSTGQVQVIQVASVSDTVSATVRIPLD